ncbi:MAG: SUMF1/EgtB/PvdO family nonheme iron enzyme [Thiogranum sp.]
MKKTLLFVGMATLLAMNSTTSQATQDENLVYIAVNPCRIVDTRAGGGAIAANTSRKFLVSGGTGALSGQGGNAAGCVDPRSTAGLAPVAVSAYIVAVPTASSTAGLLTAFPSDLADPTDAIATVNFAAGQVVGNTTTVKLCQGTSCPSAGPLAVITHNTEQDVVIDVQGYYYPAAGSCPDDMVAVGSLCVDKYEASVWPTATGGIQESGGAITRCNADGSDCGANGANPIYARSVQGVLPNDSVTWYQAAQACANVGKRLPTTGEWQAAAAGTPSGTGDGSTGCNSLSGNALVITGNAPSCVSTAGAFDMVGNLMEWSADLDLDVSTIDVNNFSDTDQSNALALGESRSNVSAITPSTKSIFVPGNGPTAANVQIGFRCVR